MAVLDSALTSYLEAHEKDAQLLLEVHYYLRILTGVCQAIGLVTWLDAQEPWNRQQVGNTHSS